MGHRFFTSLVSLFLLFSASAQSAETPSFTLPGTWIEGKALAPNIWFAFMPDTTVGKKTPLSELSRAAVQEHDVSDSKVAQLRTELGISSVGCKEVPQTISLDRSKGTRQTWCFGKKNAWAFVEMGTPSLASSTRKEILNQMSEWTQKDTR